MKHWQIFFLGVLIFAATKSFAGIPCSTFNFSFSVTNATCSSNADGSAIVTVTGGTEPYTYLWSLNSGSQTSESAIGLSADNYSVTATDINGCTGIGSVTVDLMTTETPAICMVTTDANSINNIIYWDKTPYLNVDSFIIHREVSANVYERIGAVHIDSLSEFTDTTRSVGPANGDPNLAAYRYKMQIRDNCGNYGTLSPYHNTIHITEDGLGTFSWAILYEIEGQLNPVTNYVLLCDTVNTNVWVAVNTVGPSQQSAADPGFINHSSNANWRVKTVWPISCSPLRTTVNTTRSNIRSGALPTGLTENDSDNLVMYPNPTTNKTYIKFPSAENDYVIRIYNSAGEIVSFSNCKRQEIHTLNTEILSAGIYTVTIVSLSGQLNKKLVIF